LGPAALVVGSIFVCFELRGKPGHKGRHRSRIVFPKGAKPFVMQYPDPDTAAYEKVLAEAAALFMRGKSPTENPVALLVHSFREIPKSWSARDREAALSGAIRPTSKPDWDNHAKVTDALNGIVWHDDSQVIDGRSLKFYSDRPALRIEVREFIKPNQ
jgi:Holliday junction resolvase RusA-like endonuclease